MPNFSTGANSPLGVPDFNPAIIDTTEKIAVGTIARGFDETQGWAEFIYMPGVASCAAGDLVVLDLTPGAEAVVRTLSGTHLNTGQQVGVAMAALVAGKYGWFQIAGVAVVNVLAAFAAASKVFLTTTAGSVDDAAVAGCQVLPARGVSAIGTPAAGQAYVMLNRSFVQGQIT